jgi:hypothetical protein
VTPREFTDSILGNEPPEGLDQLLLSLWYAGKGDWEKSHEIAQEITSKEAALIHAYLHREKGDLSNANYWYEKADASRPEISISEEWKSLVNQFLG